MPNWVDTNWQVTLPTKNVNRFLKYFLENDNKVDRLKGRYFYRTFIEKDSVHSVESEPGVSCLTFVSYTPWSLESILEESPASNGGLCISLDWLCQDCEVIDLHIVGDEGGEGFRQIIDYDGDCCTLDAMDLTVWSCDNCDMCGYWEDYPDDIDRTKCPECGVKLEEE